jgi:hypothetical protein
MLKASIFAKSKNRIPTRDDLFKRGIINVDVENYSLACDDHESLSQLFFNL